MSNFGNNLNNLRKKAGYSQEELAYKLNVTRQTISNWELEQTSPDLKDLKKISKVFNVSLNELISDENLKIKSTENLSKRNKLIFLIIFIIISLILMLIVISYRIFIISKIKKSVDNVSGSNNVYIEKVVFSEANFNQEIIEAYEFYFFDSKIKLVKLNNKDLSKVETIEILDNDTYYFINEIDKTFFQLPINTFYDTKNKDFPIEKDKLINEIYANCLLFDNKEYLNLIFNFRFNVKKELNKYYSMSNIKNKIDDYVSLKTSNSFENINYLRKVEKNKQNNLSDIYSYEIKTNCIESKDFEIPNLNAYKNIVYPLKEGIFYY